MANARAAVLRQSAEASGYVKDLNVVYEHTKALRLTRGEEAVVRGIRYFQEQPASQERPGYLVPSIAALARAIRYTRAWCSHLLQGLMRPIYGAGGKVERIAYVTKVIRKDGSIWYDLTGLWRAVQPFLDQAKAAPKALPDPLQPRLEQIFAGWGEVDGAPARTLQRVRKAAGRAGWSEMELKTAIAQAADKTTMAKPDRHVALFLDILERLAEEAKLRRDQHAIWLQQVEQNEAYWRERQKEERKEQRKKLRQFMKPQASPPKPEQPRPAAPQAPPAPRLAPSQHLLLAWAAQRDYPALGEANIQSGREHWLAYVLSQPLERLRRLHLRLVRS